jgi:hypothetical protein
VSLNFPGGARELMDRASFFYVYCEEVDDDENTDSEDSDEDFAPGFVICKVIIVLSFDDEE